MSPRKTRRGAKTDGVNESLLSETISKKSEEISPPPSQRTMKTRRQLSKTISQDLEEDRPREMNVSRGKNFRDTPPLKSARSRRKALVDNLEDDSSSALDPPASTTKRRKMAKNVEATHERTLPRDSSLMDESGVEKSSRATRSRIKLTKNEDSMSVDVASIIENVQRDATATSNEPAEFPMSKEDAEVQQASVRISRIRTPVSSSASPGAANKRRGRNSRAKQQNFTPESSPISVNLSPHRTTKTPRKSPMNLGGSPRSHAEKSRGLTKTPRKLPVVEESPAPSEQSLESIVTPKKSSIRSSPSSPTSPTSPTSSRSVSEKSTKRKRASRIKSPRKIEARDNFVRKFSKSPKIVLRTPKAKSSKLKSPRIVASKAKISPIVKRFAKSPMKFGQSPSPGELQRRAKEKIFDETAPTTTTTTTTMTTVESPRRANKSRSGKKSVTIVDEDTIKIMDSQRVSLHLSRIDSPRESASPKYLRNSSPDKQPRISDDRADKSPTVLLNKLSANRVVTPETEATTATMTNTRSSSRRSNASIDDSPRIITASTEKRASQGDESPRGTKTAMKKRASITDLDTPLGSSGSPRGSATKTSNVKSIIISSSKSTPVMSVRALKGKNGVNDPLLSSTPRERTRRSLNLSPGLLGIPPTIVNSPAGSSTLSNDSRATRSSRIGNVTDPLISEDDESFSLNETPRKGEQTRLDGTFEIAKKVGLDVEENEDEEDKPIDGTYELVEPKTPVLRSKVRKRSINEIDWSNEQDGTAKRTCRVRFLSPAPSVLDNDEIVVSRFGRSRSATPGHRVGEKYVDSGSGKVTLGKAASNSRKRSNSVSNLSTNKTPISGMKRRSNSASDGIAISSSKTAQNASVNRLSKPRISIHQSNKKTEVKTPVSRKAPNFAEIHQRKFAQMESLVDAKKRVEKRHMAMNSQIPTSLSKVNTAARTKPKVSPKRPAANVPVNGAYNRYGFKLKKNDAVKIVSQKKTAQTSDKKQIENRLFLKGVRTNRRFDLMMKSRNINQ